MTARAIAGLLVFNLAILVVGAGVLWGVRGWRWWTDLVRLAGVAYLLGVSVLMIVTTLGLVVEIPISTATALLAGFAIVVSGVVSAVFGGSRRRASLRPAGSFPRISLFAALFVAGILVYFEGLFRADRLAGVAREWDSWASWMPKAKELYLSGHLAPQFLLLVPQGPSYPPGPATIQAGAFHAMGSPDAVTLHLQYWFFAVGFVVAVLGLLAGRVHLAVLLPVLLALLVTPSLLDWITTVYADIPLGYLVAVAVLMLVLWIEEEKSWHLVAATLLLAGAMLTKREGVLFAGCALLAALVATCAERRRRWPRIVVAGLVALALVLPWRIWFTARGLPGDGPDTGYAGPFSHLDRVWPSVELSFTTLVDPDLWRFVPILAAAAAVLALLAGKWRVPLYAAAFVIAASAAATWVFWSNLGLALTQDESTARRLIGTTVLVLAALTPILLQQAWSSTTSARERARSPGPDALFSPSTAAWLVVLVGLLSHPGAMLAGYSGSGLPGGLPHFPGSDGCAAAPVAGVPVRVVVGYADTYPEAYALKERARAAGLDAIRIGQDGCGRLRVFVNDVASPEAATALIASTGDTELDLTVESDSTGR